MTNLEMSSGNDALISKEKLQKKLDNMQQSIDKVKSVYEKIDDLCKKWEDLKDSKELNEMKQKREEMKKRIEEMDRIMKLIQDKKDLWENVAKAVKINESKFEEYLRQAELLEKEVEINNIIITMQIENKQLKQEIIDKYNENNILEQENKALEQENKILEQENESLNNKKNQKSVNRKKPTSSVNSWNHNERLTRIQGESELD